MRRLFDRQIRSYERVRMFIAAVAILIVTAVVLALVHDPSGPSAERSKTPVSGTDVDIAISPESTRNRRLRPAPPDPVGQYSNDPNEIPPGESHKLLRRKTAAVRAAARDFFSDYLPYSYGQPTRHKLRSATPTLRRILTRNRPRVPAAERRRHPVIRHLQCELNVEVVCSALVSDGRRRYSVPLRLERHGRWLVIAIQ